MNVCVHVCVCDCLDQLGNVLATSCYITNHPKHSTQDNKQLLYHSFCGLGLGALTRWFQLRPYHCQCCGRPEDDLH